MNWDKRKLLFNQSDTLNGYWINLGGLSNNQPDVNSSSTHTLYEMSGNSEISEFYNYPNPVQDGSTTFRYFLNIFKFRINFGMNAANSFDIELKNLL